MKQSFTFILLWIAARAFAQSPVWPLATNPHNYNQTMPVASVTVSWLANPNNPVNATIPNGPLNVAHGPSMGGFDCCGNMMFYVIHSGSNNNNQLWVRNPSGFVILKDANGNDLGLNAVRSDIEIQVVRVPERCDEWYIIYLENDQSINSLNNVYNTKRLLYSHIRYNAATATMSIVNNRLNLPLSIGATTVSSYQHGKACTATKLYAIRRSLNYSSTTGHTTPIIDRYNITSSGITYEMSNAASELSHINYYYQNCPGSPLELNNAGTELAYLHYDESSGANNFYTFTTSATAITLNRTIQTHSLILKPHGTQALPASYFTGATNYTTANYPNAAQWLSFSGISNSTTITNVNFLRNFARKLSDIEYSPDGTKIYLANGGYYNGGVTNLTYLAQVDLSTYDSTNKNAQAAIKVQTTAVTFPTTANNGEGGTFSNAQSPNYYNSHAISKMEKAVDGKLYFTKIGSNRLFVLPNPNAVWANSDLYAVELDLSNTGNPNINTTNDVLFLPDHIDGYNYSPVATNISITNAPTADLCFGSTPLQLNATPTGGTWSGANISATGLFTPNATGSFTVTYIINGCFKDIVIKVKECPPTCCEQVRLQGDSACCSNLTSVCAVRSVQVSAQNGVMTSASWNCGMIPSGYIGQSTFTFTPSAACNLNMKLCFAPSATNATGNITITYTLTFTDGTTCVKTETRNCGCCPVFAVQNRLRDSVNCKIRFTNLEPDVCNQRPLSIVVSLTNGTFNFNGITTPCTSTTTTPTNYAGQSSVTLTNVCTLSQVGYIEIAPKATDCTKYVYVRIAITMSNGRVCEFRDSIKCVCSAECCAKVDAKFTMCEPDNTVKHGRFTITNLNPSVPICKITMSASPATTFLHSGLTVDGNITAQTWTPTSIPTTGNLSPAATNTVAFNLVTSATYTGSIIITVIKCDGTSCTFAVSWRNRIVPPAAVTVGPLAVQPRANLALYAHQLRVVHTATAAPPIKYVAVGFSDRTQIETNQLEFFAVSGGQHPADAPPAYLHRTQTALMGKQNVLFELAQPMLCCDDSTRVFNIVFWARKGSGANRLRFTLLDEHGEIINGEQFSVSSLSEISTKTVDLWANEPTETVELFSAYPNPATHEVTLKYLIGKSRMVQMDLYSLDGKWLQSLDKGEKQAGLHELKLAISNLPNAPYLVKFQSADKVLTTQFVVAK